ncbi:hypothetical protein KAR91_79735 [Candidatus Pacearchaeota archaeon]|nr:hypothetical protein [Candidatus Pacearchaeota archaeon]
MSGEIKRTMGIRVTLLEHDYYGNGGDGTKKTVETHETIFSEFRGMIKMIKIIGVSNIFIIIGIAYAIIKGFAK